MCITSCNTSPSLNPNAQEWRPPQLLHILPIHPALPPPSPAAAALAAIPSQNLLWQLSHHSHFYFPTTFLMPDASSLIVHLPPPLSLPEVAPPLFDGEKLLLGQLDKGRRREDSKWCNKPIRLVWKPKQPVVGGAAAISPPPHNFSASKKKLVSSSPNTTVMVRNIPNQLRRDVMLEFIDKFCYVHALEYDFMYLPMDFSRENNLGYAFVNFTSGGDAKKFKEIVHDYKWGTIKTDKGRFYSNKICATTWATIQGKDGLVGRFKDSIFRCNNPDFLPVVFDPPRSGSNTTSPVIVGRLER